MTPDLNALEVDRSCLLAAPDEPSPEWLSIAVVSHDGAQPPSLSPLDPRVTGDLSTVRKTDDVVVCYSDRPAIDVKQLACAFGNDMPAVLVAARGFDPLDVVAAFDCGATSYLLLSQIPEYCLASAAIATAAGESCLTPAAATVLLRHAYQVALPPLTEPVRAADLTPRERQIMELLVTGHTISEIASRLTLTGKTVRNKLSVIYAKLEVRRQSDAILLWLGCQRQDKTAAGR
jgi:DNA-binding NarL/FixJ family response regulator